MYKQCLVCRNGEHDNYGDQDEIKMTLITNPETGRQLKRCYLCEEHRQMFTDDGYSVELH